MLEELKNMYEKLIKLLENNELSYYQREQLLNAKTAVRILIAMED